MSILLEEWSKTESNNNFAVPDGPADNWTGSQVNDWGRELMAVIRGWYDDPEWISITRDLTTRGSKTFAQVSPSSFHIQNCDATAYFTAGRRVRMWPSAGSAVESHIDSTGAVMDGSHTLVTIIGSNVPATFSSTREGADVFFSKTIDQSSFTSLPAVADIRLTAGLPSVAATNGWLECNGDEYLATAYPALAEALGSTGAQDGYYDLHPTEGLPTIGYFRVPDLAGRVPVGFWDDATHPAGADPDAEYDYTNGATQAIKQAKAWEGSKKHEITVSEMPSHDHSGDTGAGTAHNHGVNVDSVGTAQGTVSIQNNIIAVDQDSVNSSILANESAHTHPISSQGDASNNNLDMRQASVVMGYVIYSGVL